MINRRQALQFSLGLSAAYALPSIANATSVDAVSITYGFAAGSAIGLMGQLAANNLTSAGYARSSAIAESRPGAGGRLAHEYIKRSPADGSRLLLSTVGLIALYPHVFKKLNYDGMRDFMPISTAARHSFAFAVGPMVPASIKTLPEFLEWAKKNPEKAAFGSPGTGTGMHLIGAGIGVKAGVPLQHVAFKGAAPGVTDMVGGHLAAMCAPTGDLLAYEKSKNLRILATSAKERTPFTPHVQTFTEAGYGDLSAEDFYSFFALSGTSEARLDLANASLNKIVAMPEVKESMAVQGLTAQGSTRAEIAKQVATSYEFWGELVKRVGFTPES